MSYHLVSDQYLTAIRTSSSVRAMHQYRLPNISASYPPTREDEPLVGETVFDHDEELTGEDRGELVPYAHRDIKPAYVPVFKLSQHQELY